MYVSANENSEIVSEKQEKDSVPRIIARKNVQGLRYPVDPIPRIM